MDLIGYIVIGILGLIIGSFLNVVILRLHTNKISKGRSHCVHCNHVLNSWDLIPVVSYIFLLGRCRYCHVKISKQYIFVELLTALVFILLAWRLGLGISSSNIFIIGQFVFYAFIFCSLIVLSGYDTRHFVLPWKVMRIFLLASFIGSIVIGVLGQGITFTNFVSGFITALPFWAIWHFSKGRLIGFGDIQLMCGFGFLLGISSGFAAIIVGFWSATVFVFLKMLLSKKLMHGKTPVPFGPFLALGAFIVFILQYGISDLAFNFLK